MCSKESNSVTPGTIHPLLARVDFTSEVSSSSVLPPLCFTASAAAVSCRTYGSTNPALPHPQTTTSKFSISRFLSDIRLYEMFNFTRELYNTYW